MDTLSVRDRDIQGNHWSSLCTKPRRRESCKDSQNGPSPFQPFADLVCRACQAHWIHHWTRQYIFAERYCQHIYIYKTIIYIYYCISFVESKARRGCVDYCAQQAEESAPYEFALALWGKLFSGPVSKGIANVLQYLQKLILKILRSPTVTCADSEGRVLRESRANVACACELPVKHVWHGDRVPRCSCHAHYERHGTYVVSHWAVDCAKRSKRQFRLPRLRISSICCHWHTNIKIR